MVPCGKINPFIPFFPVWQVGMFYTGKLKKNNKEFDSTISGQPFKFKLGKGEVIKGWDEGIKGNLLSRLN